MNYQQSVDNMVMNGHNERKLSTYLTEPLRFLRASEPRSRYRSLSRKIAIGSAICLAASMVQQVQLNAATYTSTDHYKLYLHSKIINYKEFQCAIDVAHHESRWRVNARNGSHYGLFQIKNIKVKNMDAYTQIDWWLRYVAKRYDNQPCEALKHWKRYGWQ